MRHVPGPANPSIDGAGGASANAPGPATPVSPADGAADLAWLSREIVRLVDRVSDDAVCALDCEGRVTLWNSSATRLFGWTEAEALGQSHAVLFADAEIAARRPDTLLARTRAEGEIREDGWRLRKDGSEFMVRVVTSVLVDRAGAPAGFAQFMRDITEQTARMASIEASATLLHSILATVPDAMVVIDEHGLITSFSAAAQAMFGYGEAEVVGRNVSILMAPPDSATHDGSIARYLATGKARIIGKARRVIGRRKDGTTFPHDLAVGEAIGGGKRVFTGFMRDLSAREESDARLQDLQAELLHISRVGAMGTMASTLAHELNQPLTAVANYVETSLALLKAPTADTNAIVVEALAEATAEAHRAGAIVRRLREFMARGDLDRRPEPVPRLIDDACELGLLGAHEKGISTRREIDPSVGPVFIDRVQVQQVLINLLRNAVEAMAPMGSGTITVFARTLGSFVEFVVADTGPGLAPEVGEQLFKAFVSTKRNGMGLGLSICRTIIEAHGGRIWAETPETGGTAFHFTVLRAKAETDDV